jgi:hypothetical protein
VFWANVAFASMGKEFFKPLMRKTDYHSRSVTDEVTSGKERFLQSSGVPSPRRPMLRTPCRQNEHPHVLVALDLLRPLATLRTARRVRQPGGHERRQVQGAG